MKKSLLLCTISGSILCSQSTLSYALDAVAPVIERLNVRNLPPLKPATYPSIMGINLAPMNSISGHNEAIIRHRGTGEGYNPTEIIAPPPLMEISVVPLPAATHSNHHGSHTEPPIVESSPTELPPYSANYPTEPPLEGLIQPPYPPGYPPPPPLEGLPYPPNPNHPPYPPFERLPHSPHYPLGHLPHPPLMELPQPNHHPGSQPLPPLAELPQPSYPPNRQDENAISMERPSVESTDRETVPRKPDATGNTELKPGRHPDAVLNSEISHSTSERPKQEKPIPERPIEQDGDIQSEISAEKNKTTVLHNANVQSDYVAVNSRGENATIEIVGGTILSKFIGLNASDGGNIDATSINITAASTGLLSENGTINLEGSTIRTTYNFGAHGIALRGVRNAPSRYIEDEKNENATQEVKIVNHVTLTNTKIFSENGIGIGVYGAGANSEVNLINSEVHSDILSKNEKDNGAPAHILTLTAKNSLLEGRVRVLEDNKTTLILNNNTKWLLKQNKNTRNNDKDPSDYKHYGIDARSYSNLSILNLQDSSIVFDKPTAGNYQTLYIGSKLQQGDNPQKTTVVYNATGKAQIHLNSQWSSNYPVTEQKTDRIIIDGDVSGTTIVHINLLENSREMTNKSPVEKEYAVSFSPETDGISIIQISGPANKNSFKMEKEYFVMGGSPYRYTLTAYQPKMSDANQNLFGRKDNNFWDFRLQRSPLPQVANYLVMPNAVFSAGLVDINNQNILLSNMRTTVFESEYNEKRGIFFSPYGEKANLFSNHKPRHHGYDASMNYAALQVGAPLAALEGEDTTTHFGLLGSYGKLSFTPKDVKDSEKTQLSKWSAIAYGDFQHKNGTYLNALLSYGLLKGNITTAIIGTAAELDNARALSASATIGQRLATSTKGLTFEPQMQLIYQKLMFGTISDVQSFEVNVGSLHQLLIRIGGRLIQTTTTTEEDNRISFYGKLNFLKAFGNGGTIKIVDNFHIDKIGSSIEGGIGINAYLSQHIALHGDISYRHKLQKEGVSGTNFSGGIHYLF
ncbi:autotransporter outer membrane beta-barrel domain-containing protein [Bartonella sp. B41]